MSDLTDAIAQTFGSLVGLPVVGLAGRLLLIGLVILWVATAWWVWRDATVRTGDPLLRAVATAGIVLATPLLFPFAAVVYLVLRPPLPDDASQALELQLAELTAGVDPDRCPHCGARVAAGWRRCPACGQVLTVPCPTCGEPVGLDWLMCAWCAGELPWVAEPAGIPPATPAPLSIPIVPGGRPLVPVMAVPDDEDRGPRLAGAATAAARSRQLRRERHHDVPPRGTDRELRGTPREGPQAPPGHAPGRLPR